MSAPRRAAWSATFADIAPERLWRWISDTDFVNRSAGLPAVRYVDGRAADGSRRITAIAHVGPLRFAWIEPPFTWEAPHRVAQERHFLTGPFRRFASETRVEAAGSGSRVTQSVELESRDALGTLLSPAVLHAGRRGGLRAFAAAARRARLDRAADDRVRDPVPPDVAAASTTVAARFIDATRVLPLRGDRVALERIARRVAAIAEHGPGTFVARIRPYVLADAWDEPRELVLAVMLAATRASLLDLAWTIICPTCRGQNGDVVTLAALGRAVHCPTCNVDYDEEFDRNVEFTFSAAPLGRTIDADVYCALGPHTSRQTYAQVALPAGATADVHVTLPPGAYVVQRMVDRQIRFVVAREAPSERLTAEFGDDRLALDEIAVRPGPLVLRVTNRGATDALVRVTESELSAQLATAADVTALQDFRDLFGSEVLAEGVELAIRSMTIVFTDLVGSTRLYVDKGDAGAFRVVRQHFDALRAVVAAHRGTIVKTIGDAVMAAFPDPLDALEAARRFAPAVAAVDHRPELRIRVGLHRGPCIAMRANDRLDYFGSTVNLASRVQHAADGGEVILTAELAQDPRVAPLVSPGRRELLAVRGFDQPVAVVRVPALEAALPA